MDLKPIDRVKKYYSDLEPRMDLFYAAEKGPFLGGHIPKIYGILEELVDDGVLSPDKTFLDAGSGDGRIVAIAAVLGLRAFGIEWSEPIYEASKEDLEMLSEENIFPKTPTVVKGDFFDFAIYKELGIEFEEINVFYSYETFTKELGKLIVDHSPPKTVLLHHSQNNDPITVEGLSHIKTVPVINLFQFLHVFMKD